jgi:hypothetical protein
MVLSNPRPAITQIGPADFKINTDHCSRCGNMLIIAPSTYCPQPWKVLCTGCGNYLLSHGPDPIALQQSIKDFQHYGDIRTKPAPR